MALLILGCAGFCCENLAEAGTKNATKDCDKVRNALRSLYLESKNASRGDAFQEIEESLNSIYSLEHKIDWRSDPGGIKNIGRAKSLITQKGTSKNSIDELKDSLDIEIQVFCILIKEIREEAFRFLSSARNSGCMDEDAMDPFITKFNRYSYDQNSRCGFMGETTGKNEDHLDQIKYPSVQYGTGTTKYIDEEYAEESKSIWPNVLSEPVDLKGLKDGAR